MTVSFGLGIFQEFAIHILRDCLSLTDISFLRWGWQEKFRKMPDRIYLGTYRKIYTQKVYIACVKASTYAGFFKVHKVTWLSVQRMCPLIAFPKRANETVGFDCDWADVALDVQ